MARKPTPAKNRFSEFRSWAREITSEANEMRKFGAATDVNGKLARAMEKAYKMGFEDAQKSGDPQAVRPRPTDVRHYNSRVQSVIHRLGVWNNGTREHFDPSIGPRAFYVQDEVHERPFSDKPPQWRVVQPGHTDDDTFADSTINQAFNKGLLRYATLLDGPLEGRRVAYLTEEGVDAYRQLFVDPYKNQSEIPTFWELPDD